MVEDFFIEGNDCKRNPSIYEQLKLYAQGNAYPFHMPGHKRNLSMMENVYQIDITEIDGFDDLHHAEGMLREGMDRLAVAVGAGKSYYIVNGSTCGILAALYGACPEGGKVAAARNTHKSVAHGIILRRLQPIYIYPQNVDKMCITGKVIPKDIEIAYKKNEDICAVIITSPTYEGIVSDIAAIAEIVHQHNGILIVDEAHGAHLPYGEEGLLPPSAIHEGADIVIQSLHKTLPSLTQSAALHICSERVDRRKIERALRIFETSSPSYVLMAGIDLCVRYMQGEGSSRLVWLCGRLKQFYEKARSWKELWFLHLNLEEQSKKGIVTENSWDYTKIVFGARRYSGIGRRLHSLLVEKYRLQPEMSTPDYVLLMTMLTDTEEGFSRLEGALEEINCILESGFAQAEDLRTVQNGMRSDNSDSVYPVFPAAKQVILPSEAAEASAEPVIWEHAEGRICKETVYIYPPGCPFLMPGERIEREHAELAMHYRDAGMHLYGMEDESGAAVLVIQQIM